MPPSMGTITELGIALADLVESHAEWSQATFGPDADKGPIGSLRHLESEAREAVAAAMLLKHVAAGATEADRKAAFAEEVADCLLLVLDASRRGGVKVMQLIEAARAKMVVNRAREWPKAKAADEAVEHVREL